MNNWRDVIEELVGQHLSTTFPPSASLMAEKVMQIMEAEILHHAQ
jgi:hypothetical protein